MELNLGYPLFLGAVFWVVISLVVVWQAVWKGIALWKAGRNGHLGWFIAMFVLNTLAILEIIYIFGFSRKKENIDAGKAEPE